MGFLTDVTLIVDKGYEARLAAQTRSPTQVSRERSFQFGRDGARAEAPSLGKQKRK